jgi:hypothetical protein
MEAPQNVNYDSSTGIVTWDPVDGATSYDIYVSATESGTYSFYKNVEDTECSMESASMNKGYLKIEGKNEEEDGPWSSPPQPWERPTA